jgi:phospholipase C
MRGQVIAWAALAFAACADPQRSAWGLDAITTLQTPPDPVGPPMCGVQLPSTGAFGRDHCQFASGDLPATTLGIGADLAAQIPITHVIVLMKENRSFDHLLGKLHDLNPKVEAVPDGFSNPDLDGVSVPFVHATTTCLSPDPGHQSESMRTAVDDGKMDGFVINAAQTTDTDGHYVMAYYEPADLPFYYWLASTFALNQAHFAPVVSGTYANRNFFYFGDNAGAVDTGIVYADPATPSIFHLLMNAGKTWGAYAPDNQSLSNTTNWYTGDPGVHSLQDFYDALDNGTLPSVAFVDGEENVNDDHPTADLQDGEAWVKTIYDHAVKSPQWKRLAIIWTYDEGGAFPDHVKPGTGCRSTPTSPWTDRGVRIPLVVISPWARRGFVSQVPEDHTAITRFIETVFQLPALTARDANSPALLDMFDFSCGADTDPPVAPGPGTGGCPNPPMP